MPADLDKYRHYLDGYNLDEAQKAELIHSVWAIMESFADRAFGLHPVQQVTPSQSGADSNRKAHRVGSQEDHSTTIHFKQAAGPIERREGTDHEGE